MGIRGDFSFMDIYDALGIGGLILLAAGLYLAVSYTHLDVYKRQRQ